MLGDLYVRVRVPANISTVRDSVQNNYDRDVTGVQGNILAALGQACGELEDGASDN